MARTSSGCWPRNSASGGASRAFIDCCTSWATAAYDRGHATRKSDSEALLAFKAGWPERIAKIAREHPGQRLRVYFQDESRFGQLGTNTNVWAKKSSRPTAVRQTEYRYLWVLGAVCPQTSHAQGLLSPRLDTKIVNSFLELFAKTIPAGEHEVMVWDGAGFHTAKALAVPENVTLVRLPPYSPELNPIENL